MPNGGARERQLAPTYGQQSYAAKDRQYRRMIILFRRKSYRVHRLVCEAFHGPCPEDATLVMHENEDSLDNRPENLRWATQKDNLNCPGFIAYCKTRTGDNNPRRKGMSR
jgi:hypothetical protein